MRGRERFGEVVPCAGTERFDTRGHARIPRHDHDDGILTGLQRRFEDLHPRYGGHIEVDQHDVEATTLYQINRFVASPNRGHVEAVHLQHASAPFSEGAIVIHNQ